MMIGTVVLIIWLVLKFIMEKASVFHGKWVFYAYLIEIGAYLGLLFIMAIIGALVDN